MEIAKPTTRHEPLQWFAREVTRAPGSTSHGARRTGEGLFKKEIHRCLKRYIVRELYPLILADLKDSAASA